MWEAWNLSKAYQTLPSVIYGITDEIAAWCFDRAVHLFGSTLENELTAAANGAKNKTQSYSRQQSILKDWLGIEPKFASPSGAGKSTEVTQQQDSGPVSL